MKDLSLKEMVDWLIENEGCEIADGWEALKTFLSYCVNDEDGLIESSILEMCKNDIAYQYDTVKVERELQDEEDEDLCAEIIIEKFLKTEHNLTDEELKEQIKRIIRIYS